MSEHIVDFTEHHDFSSHNVQNEHRMIIDFIENLFQFPWDIPNECKNSCSENDKELLFTGNKDEILLKKEEVAYRDNLYCDRCGKIMFPWEQTFGICSVCNDDLDEEVSPKVPWGNNRKEESLEERSLIEFLAL